MFRLHRDAVLIWTLRGCAALGMALLAVVVLFLIRESIPALINQGGTAFFSDEGWYPVEGAFNLTPMLWGTLLTASGAAILAFPLGLLSAIFCHYYAPPPIGILYRRVIEMMAGIPSVVYGFWGLMALVPLINTWHAPGLSLLTGMLVLTLMILPTVAVLADAGFAAIPRDYLRSAQALGLSRWRTVWDLALPIARSSVLAAIVLALARALGETMAVLMVTGNLVETPRSVFDPVRTLTANIALEMAYAMGDHRSALFVTGLVLMVIVALLVSLAARGSKIHVHAL